MHVQVARTLDEHVSQYCQVVLETCAYAGTGDVLKVQEMLATAGEHLNVEDGAAWKVGTLSPALHPEVPLRPSACAAAMHLLWLACSPLAAHGASAAAAAAAAEAS